MNTRAQLAALQPAPDAPASEWAARIVACWRASVEGIIEAGRLLTEARHAIGHGNWQEMCEKELPFTPRTAQMLMAIAKDPRLTNPKRVSLLPPNWGTLYELTKLEDDQFEAKVEDGTIRPDMERRDISQSMKAERRATREQTLGKTQSMLPGHKFGVVVADPEWSFTQWSKKTGMDRAADNHYPTSNTETIMARRVDLISAPDCVLFLWATVPMLPQALATMAAWGFAYKSHFVWVKDKIGTGYWNRNKHELLLIGTKGDIPAPAMGDQSASAIESPVGAHSAKPEEFLQIIEDYFPTLPKIELNRRGEARPGWSAWGNEALPPHDPETGEIIETPQAAE